MTHTTRVLPEMGKFLILAKSRRFNGEFCFLVDRRMNANQWRQSQTDGAMIFESLNSAQQTCRLYVHNSPMVVTLEEALWVEKNYNGGKYMDAVQGLTLYNKNNKVATL